MKPTYEELEAKLAELDGQEPVGYFYPSHETGHLVQAGDPIGFPGMTPLYARPIPAEPVNAQLLEALTRLKIEVVLSDIPPDYIESHFREHLDKAEEAIIAAEAQGVTGPKRLTDEEIETIWQIVSGGHQTFARAIEAAVLRKQK